MPTGDGSAPVVDAENAHLTVVDSGVRTPVRPLTSGTAAASDDGVSAGGDPANDADLQRLAFNNALENLTYAPVSTSDVALLAAGRSASDVRPVLEQLTDFQSQGRTCTSDSSAKLELSLTARDRSIQSGY